jgi:gas vesicle protein
LGIYTNFRHSKLIHDKDKESRMGKVIRFFEGFLSGAAVGSILAVLLAPTSGPDLQARINARVAQVQAEVRQAAEGRRTELEKQLNELRAPKPGGS